MKKKNLLLCLLITIVFFSCSSDDDNNNNTSASIIGSWNLIEVNGNSSITCPLNLVISDSQIIENEYYGNDCSLLDSITDSYSFNGETFTIETDSENIVFKVISLTESNLVWETNDPDTNEVTNLKYKRIE